MFDGTGKGNSVFDDGNNFLEFQLNLGDTVNP